MKTKVLFFFGTRPEAIKLAPLLAEMRRKPDDFETRVCVSGQHREMLDQAMGFFRIKPNYDLGIMRPGQSLFDVTSKALVGLKKVMDACKPSWLIVQGDTTSTFAGALAGYYEGVKVAHVEAGLRSWDKQSPFPEEMNRVLTTRLADLHFAPTREARANLLKEGISIGKIFVTGNTGIDALFLCLRKVRNSPAPKVRGLERVDWKKNVILVTGHRRESFGRPFKEICWALADIAQRRDVEIVYPVHLNPNVREPVHEILRKVRRVHLIQPVDYPTFVWLMDKCKMILTDSGGIQEEAPSLGKPVLVMREVTERLEGIEAGTAILAGTDRHKIVSLTKQLLVDKRLYAKMAKAKNPYGDGRASQKIARVIKNLGGL